MNNATKQNASNLTTNEREQTTLQLICLLARGLSRVESRLTGEATGDSLSIIEHALELMRQIDAESFREKNSHLLRLPRKQKFNGHI